MSSLSGINNCFSGVRSNSSSSYELITQNLDIQSITNAGTLFLPNLTCTLIGNNTYDTLCNKIISYPTINYSYINEPIIDSGNMSNCTLSNSYMSNIDIHNSDLDNGNITHFTFNHGVIVESTLNNSYMSNIDMNNSNLNHIDMNNSTLNNGVIVNSNITNSSLSNSVLNNGNIDNYTLNNSILIDCKLDNGNIDNYTLNNSILINSNINNSTLNNVVLNHPIIKNEELISLPNLRSTLSTLNLSETLYSKTLISPYISHIINNNGVISLFSSSDTIIGRSTIDELHNKTIISPTISSIYNSGILTLPNGPDYLISRMSNDSIYNKSIINPIIYNNNNQLILPNISTSLIGHNTIDSLSNKTLISPVIINPNISNLNMSNTSFSNANISNSSLSNSSLSNANITDSWLGPGKITSNIFLRFNSTNSTYTNLTSNLDISSISNTSLYSNVNDVFYIGSDQQFSSIILNVITAQVSSIPIFEYSNNSNGYTSFNIMNVQGSFPYLSYANIPFSSSSEIQEIRFDQRILSSNINSNIWSKNTINGLNKYWIRIRITNLTTSAQIRYMYLISNGIKLDNNGMSLFYGYSRKLTNLLIFINAMDTISGFTLSNHNVWFGNNSSLGISNNEFKSTNARLATTILLSPTIDTSTPLNLWIQFISSSSNANQTGNTFEITTGSIYNGNSVYLTQQSGTNIQNIQTTTITLIPNQTNGLLSVTQKIPIPIHQIVSRNGNNATIFSLDIKLITPGTFNCIFLTMAIESLTYIEGAMYT